MLYALIFYTELEKEGILTFRKKYDPWWDLIQDHLTLIFPVPGSIGLEKITRHIETVLEGWDPFKIRLSRLEKSWDHFLFLTLDYGNSNVIRLHDELYSGILGPFENKEIKFIPHIGIGHFSIGEYDPLNPERLKLDEETFNKAMMEAQNLCIDCVRKVDKLTLVELDENLSGCRDINQFQL